jgi:hypothetical protein
LNVTVRADDVLAFDTNDLTRALGAGAVQEGEDAGGMVGEGKLHQAGSNRQSNACGAQWSLVWLHGPGVMFQSLYDIAQIELAVLDGLQEAHALLVPGAAPALAEPERFLHLLQCGLFVTSEHIRLGALLVADLVHLNDGSKCD